MQIVIEGSEGSSQQMRPGKDLYRTLADVYENIYK